LFQGLGNMAGLLRQAQQMSGRLQAVQTDLKAATVTGSAGGGLVEVRMNGLGEMLQLTIDPSLIQRGEQGLIEDLVPAAVNDAAAKARQLHAEAMKSLTSGLDVPGLGDALAQLTGGTR
jgi:nucleoid-associated protein EbfC